MNPLDVILSASILTAGLFGKYSGFNIQFNKLLAILLSILITKVIFIELIIFFIPYIGLSAQTKPRVYFISIVVLYFILKSIFNILQSNLENLHKNKFIDSILGIIAGLINGVVFISIFISVIFYSFTINENTTLRLKQSTLFNKIHLVKTVLVDYGE